jgi:LPS-assembly protein
VLNKNIHTLFNTGKNKVTAVAICCAAAVFYFVFPHPATAQDLGSVPWKISADRLTHTSKPEKIIAEGNVILQQNGGSEAPPQGSLQIKADRIEYDPNSQIARAVGNLKVKTGEDSITAADGEVSLREQTGTFNQAILFHAENNMYLRSAVMKKTGRQTYHLQDGWVTTCPVGDDAPTWSITSRDIRITEKGYAIVRDASFLIKNTKLLYSPFLILPAKTSRQTGFLFPEISQSERNGSGLLAPFFINLSPSYDITLFPGYYGKRGVTGGAEFRYMADHRSMGMFSATYLNDITSDTRGDDYKSDGYLRTDEHRWWLRGKLDHYFNNGVITRLDIDLLSDRDYLQEFYKDLNGFAKNNQEYVEMFNRGFQAETITARENIALVSKNWTTTNMFGELRLIDDAGDQLPGTDSPVWTLPRLSISSIMPINKTPFDLSWQSEYSYFWRKSGRKGQRLDLHPRLHLPLALTPWLESAVSGGIRETLYLADDTASGTSSNDTWHSRTLTDADITVATTLLRDFSLSKGLFRHLFRPEAGYHYGSSVNQSELPLFDENDRIAAKNWFSLNLTNYFFQSSNKSLLNFRDWGYLKLSQAYDIHASSHQFSDIFLELGLRPLPEMNITYDTVISIHGQGIPHYNLEARYRNDRGTAVSLDYRYKRHSEMQEPFFYTTHLDDSIHELNVAFQKRVTETITLQFNQTHSFSTDQVVDSTLRVLYQPGCWSMEVAASKTADGSRAMVIFSLTGIGKALEIGLPGL